jgi:hypothetical protein
LGKRRTRLNPLHLKVGARMPHIYKGRKWVVPLVLKIASAKLSKDEARWGKYDDPNKKE